MFETLNSCRRKLVRAKIMPHVGKNLAWCALLPNFKKNQKRNKIFIAGGGCLTGESEPSRAAARFWFIRADAPPTGYERLSFNPYLVRLFVVQLKRRSINLMRKRVWISGSETLFRPFHVFIFNWLLHGNGCGQLKEARFLANPLTSSSFPPFAGATLGCNTTSQVHSFLSICWHVGLHRWATIEHR